MASKTSHLIKQRKTPKDIFITPIEVAKKQIQLHTINENDIWLDPCRNNEEGSYYKNFPNNVKKDWCEELENKDFFKYNENVNIICCNPPYSILDKWIEKTLELNPDEFSFLIGIGNLTTRRIEKIENKGYGLLKMKMLKIYKWYGMSVMVLFKKNTNSIIEYDRKVYR